MVVSRMLAPVHSLGPGERVCLWTQGCSKKCYKCISPEMQPFFENGMDNDKLSSLIIDTAKKCECNGLTISGGDPFEQSDKLLEVLKSVRTTFNDILVYTGFTLEEILNGSAGTAGKICLDYLDVLIDGRYIDKLNKEEFVLRGSQNQKIHFFNMDLKPLYDSYMAGGRLLETFNTDSATIITGIMSKNALQG
ncbi:MAG: radical SAM protein [Eubacterium sp.]|nr:radical SAM protein [Eubacterium sp.]